MALLAICSQLALVNVGMAVLTALSDIGEDGFDMASGACDRCVHAPKRIFSLVVIEFWKGADRFPRLGGVAVLAWYVQIPVRAVRAVDLRPSHTESSNQRQKQQ